MLVVSVLFVSCSAQNQKTGSKEPVFRYIQVGWNTKIHLGDPITKANGYLVNASGKFVMNPTLFGGIVIELVPDSANKITEMRFTYGPETDYSTFWKDYTSTLGAPTIKEDHVFWDDGKTRFEIYKAIPNERPRITSRLFDKKNQTSF